MARFLDHDTEGIYTIADRWKKDCLLGGTSLLWGSESVWTSDVLESFKTHVINRDADTKESFEKKLKNGLNNADENVTKLATELMLVYFLFPVPSSISGERKREWIQNIVSWKGLELSEGAIEVLKVLDTGIGSPGQAYLSWQWEEVTFLAKVAIKLISMVDEVRRAYINDHAQLRGLLDNVRQDRAVASRNILLHLLHPDRYERIASYNHKKLICGMFREFLENIEWPRELDQDDMDDRLYVIRTKLGELPAKELDFYRSPLWECWGVAGESGDLHPLQGLDIKKQIVFYGPPGTGKTFEAREWSDRLIRQGLLRKWGPRRFLEAYYATADDLDKIVRKQIRRVQFHPGYSYEDFVRGLQLIDGGKTEYRDGVLLKIVERLEKESGELKEIPFVVILDEMNRADLSKVLGECFSLMEDRNNPVQLAGQDENHREVALPDNLYFIGTMNLIDQSLEQVDFALRRRFLWFFRGFDRKQFLNVAEHRWNKEHKAGRIKKKWDKHADEFETLANRAEKLNASIENRPSLGNQYQIGHTYFCDVVSFVQQDLIANPGRQFVLYNKKGKGRDETIGILWQYSIKPLLEQYLSGVDSGDRDTFIKEEEKLFKWGDE